MNDRSEDFSSFTKQILRDIHVYDPLDREIPGYTQDGEEAENVATSRQEMLEVIKGM